MISRRRVAASTSRPSSSAPSMLAVSCATCCAAAPCAAAARAIDAVRSSPGVRSSPCEQGGALVLGGGQARAGVLTRGLGVRAPIPARGHQRHEAGADGVGIGRDLPHLLELPPRARQLVREARHRGVGVLGFGLEPVERVAGDLDGFFRTAHRVLGRVQLLRPLGQQRVGVALAQPRRELALGGAMGDLGLLCHGHEPLVVRLRGHDRCLRLPGAGLRGGVGRHRLLERSLRGLRRGLGLLQRRSGRLHLARDRAFARQGRHRLATHGARRTGAERARQLPRHLAVARRLQRRPGLLHRSLWAPRASSAASIAALRRPVRRLQPDDLLASAGDRGLRWSAAPTPPRRPPPPGRGAPAAPRTT